MGFAGLAPSASLLLIGLLLDAVFGDPQLRLHPIRLIGDTLTAFERFLRRIGLSGYFGGFALFHVAGRYGPETPARLDGAPAEQNLLALRDDCTDHDLGIDVMDPAAVAADMALMSITLRYKFGKAEILWILHWATDACSLKDHILA